MLLFAFALGLMTLLAVLVEAGTPRARLTVRPGAQAVTVWRWQRLLLVNGDIRPHRLVEPHVRLERPGDAHVLRFRKRGVYVLHTYPGPSLVPWLADAPREGATLRITVR